MKSSGINTIFTAAITSVYQLVFSSKTKCAGISYLGLDQPETAQKLFIGCLGKITKNTNQTSYNYHNYSASLFHNQIVAEYKDISLNAVWNKTGILTFILGYFICYKSPMIMEKLYEFHLKETLEDQLASNISKLDVTKK
ncbi:6489_t:CDS:2 [Diversispora eburnea]|uniref:6489_t:CDS:1 n=1 Tax=Diversispora eburnea TaxID=1213867 RepID=A0A9N8V6F0_9GLOM|nr:6489_t:CDS:2 [Diversispora eburnea]